VIRLMDLAIHCQVSTTTKNTGNDIYFNLNHATDVSTGTYRTFCLLPTSILNPASLFYGFSVQES